MRILTVGLAGMSSGRSLKDGLRLHLKHSAGTAPLAGQMFIMASLRGKMVLAVRRRTSRMAPRAAPNAASRDSLVPVSPQLGERKKSEELPSLEVNGDGGTKRRLRCWRTPTWRRVTQQRWMWKKVGPRTSCHEVCFFTSSWKSDSLSLSDESLPIGLSKIASSARYHPITVVESRFGCTVPPRQVL